MLALVGLNGTEAKRRIRNYSLGMRQRLGIANAMLGDPSVLILDEPVNGLDPAGIHWMRGVLRQFAGNGGTVLLSSHLLHEVEMIADELIVIGRGKIVAQGTRAELLQTAGTYVKGLDADALAAALQGAGIAAAPSGDGGLPLRGRTGRRRSCGCRGRGRARRAEARRGRRSRGDVPAAHRRRCPRRGGQSHRPRGRSPRMSTTTAAAPTTLDVSSTPRVPFARLVKVELRKTYDTRAGIWLLGITTFLAAAVMVVALIIVLVQDESIKLDDFVGIANFITGFLLPVLGIMLVTSEWSQRTAMVTFTLEAHRGRVVAAKLVAGLLLALIVSLIATVSALVVNGIYAVAHGGGDWHFGLLAFLGFLLTQVFAMLTGFAFATLLLNTAAAIVVYFAYKFVIPTIFAIAAQFIDWFKHVQPWVDFAQAQTPLFDASMHGKDWAHLLVSGLIWLVIPVALGLWRILRAEVK